MESYAFGPGSLESVALQVRTRTVGHRRQQVRVVGSYTVYCGSGWSHEVPIRSTWENLSEFCASFELDQNDHEAVAYALVDLELDDWFDPCEE